MITESGDSGGLGDHAMSAGPWSFSPGASVIIGEQEVVLTHDDPVREYLALRQESGHYDLGTCGLVRVHGDGALSVVQRALTRDVQYLLPEACLTALVVDGDGLIYDVVTVFTGDDGSFELQTSIGSGSAVGGALQRLRHKGDAGGDVDLIVTRQSAIAIEGPRAWSILEKLGLEHVIDLPFQGVRATAFRGERIRVARTGVTGEFGVQLIGRPEVIAGVREDLASMCRQVGLAALEAAMLDVRHPVPWRECARVEVVRAGLQWLVDHQKDGYIGRAAILRQAEAISVSRVGFMALEPATILPQAPVRTAEQAVGQVIWSTFSPGRGTVLGVVELPHDICVPGLRLVVDAADAAGLIRIETLSSPMVVPGSWAVVAAERAAQFADGGEQEPA